MSKPITVIREKQGFYFGQNFRRAVTDLEITEVEYIRGQVYGYVNLEDRGRVYVRTIESAIEYRS